MHPEISKVWLDDVEIPLENTQRLDGLEAKVTKEFPSGLLDLKIQVLDRIIERKNYYQSTTPVINELDKTATGFLDTLTIKGDYFLQRNKSLEVLVGNRAQRIIESSKTELKIVIDSYFKQEIPRLVLKTGSYELTENVTMLPPEIISFNKEKYHLYDEEIIIKTRYFLGSNPNVKIGLTTAYGSTEKNFKVFETTIESLSKDVYFHDASIRVNGLDFGYDEVTKVYVDEVEVPDTNNSSYSVANKGIVFRVPDELLPGTHIIKVVTGGQISNEIQFEIGSITASAIQTNSGTRKNVFTVTGTNLDKTYAYRFQINGFHCTVLNASPNQVQIRLPYFIPLEPMTEIEFLYGDQVTVAGSIGGIEPYEIFQNYKHPTELNKYSASFEYNGKLYGIGPSGIYEFNTASKSWSIYETNIPDFTAFTFNNHHVSA